jgi:hypothetical protein
LTGSLTIILDLCGSGAMSAASGAGPVWAVQSPENDAQATLLRQQGCDCTIFSLPLGQVGLVEVLDDVVLHHPVCSNIKLVGVAVTPEMIEGLRRQLPDCLNLL